MKKIAIAASIAAGLVASGCTTQYTALEQAEDDAKCRNVGHAQKTSGYNDCMALAFAARDQQNRKNNEILATAAVGAIAIASVAAIAVAAHNTPRYWCQPHFPYRCYYY